MLISVIIAAYNKPYHLDRVLTGYEQQNDQNFEIIVADDGSSESVKKVIDAHAETAPFNIRHFWQEDDGFRKTRALNSAMEMAEGEYIILTDDDCLPAPNFVAAHRSFSKRGQYIVGSYNRLPQKTTDLVTNRIVKAGKPFNLLWLMTNGYVPTRGFLRLIIPEWLGRLMDLRGKLDSGRLPGGNASFFLEDAKRVGGFNEKMTYGREDREFGTRLHHAGVKARRMKNTTYVLHLEHERGYVDFEHFQMNEKILRETISRKRIRPDD